MAATKLAFLNQPISTTTGYTIQAQTQDSVNLRENHGLRVAVQDASGNTVTTDTSNVTIALSGTGTLSGTLTAAAVNGVATFSNLAIAGSGSYALVASDGALTTATTRTFTITDVARINPANLTGTITAAGIGVAGSTLGPYRLRLGSLVSNQVAISVFSTGTADLVDLYLTQPGVALSAATGVTPAQFASNTMDVYKTLGDADLYLVGSDVSGIVSAGMAAIRAQARV